MTISIDLVQINNGFSGRYYLPYSAGVLQAYVQGGAADPGRYRFLEPLYKRLPVDVCVESLREADVVGFSNYVWNANISLELARRLKQDCPDLLTVFGGPHVPNGAEAFLRRHPYVDIAVHGEGERGFLEILEAFPEGDFSAIGGISYLDGAGGFVHVPSSGRMRDFSSVPSPYLTGVFDPLMAANPGEAWLAMFESNRGCPFSCTYCDWGSAVSSKVVAFPLERVRGEMEWFAKHGIEFVFCCDANFGILPRDVEIAELAVEIRERTGFPKALSVQNTKNATERAYRTQKILADSGLGKGVTISVQTNDPYTLKQIKRDNISLESFGELQRRFIRDGFITYTDFIIGLPGETYDSFADGVDHLIRTGQHNRIQFNNLTILPNAEMGGDAYIAEHGLKTVDTRIVNIHGSLDDPEDGIEESQLLVVATKTLPEEDWRRTKMYAWLASLLHFDKLLQFPLLVLHYEGGVPFRRIFETFADVDGEAFPQIAEIRDFLVDEALANQRGGTEYVFSREWLNIHWPADEYALVKLCIEGKLERFYEEAGRLLSGMAKKSGIGEILEQALDFNRVLLIQPFQEDDVVLKLDYDLASYRRAILRGEKPDLERRPVTCRIERSGEVWNDWESWMREVVWYRHRKGAYLYGNSSEHRGIAGHY